MLLQVRNQLIPRFLLDRRRLASRVLSALTFVLAVGAAYADSVLDGRVVGLADGDTITVLDAGLVQHKVRVASIDAPEKRQPFGNRSKANLASLVMGKQVQVHWRKKDRYGRVVGVVVVGGLDAGLEQVRSGMAWHYRAYANEQTHEQRLSYAAAEQNARSRHLGLWRDSSPVAPWDFRSATRGTGARRF